MSDFEKLLKKNPKPSMSQAKKAERGEQAEGVRDTLKSGKGDIVSGSKKRNLKKEGLPGALNQAKKFQSSLKRK